MTLLLAGRDILTEINALEGISIVLMLFTFFSVCNIISLRNRIARLERQRAFIGFASQARQSHLTSPNEELKS